MTVDKLPTLKGAFEKHFVIDNKGQVLKVGKYKIVKADKEVGKCKKKKNGKS